MSMLSSGTTFDILMKALFKINSSVRKSGYVGKRTETFPRRVQRVSDNDTTKDNTWAPNQVGRVS